MTKKQDMDKKLKCFHEWEHTRSYTPWRFQAICPRCGTICDFAPWPMKFSMSPARARKGKHGR